MASWWPPWRPSPARIRSTAVRLGIAMTALQASIGSLNDVVDAPRDAGHKPGKPIPAGLVSAVSARVLVIVAAAVGLVLSAPSGAGRSPWPPWSSRSGTATTSPSRGPPGRGSRSRSVSRCFPCSAGLARPAACRPPSPCSCPLPSWPGPGSPSPTPGPTSSATRRPGSIPWRSGSGSNGRGRSRRC